jgi:hypothetical protein
MPEGIKRILMEREGRSEEVADQMIAEYERDMDVILAEMEEQEFEESNRPFHDLVEAQREYVRKLESGEVEKEAVPIDSHFSNERLS